MTLTLFWSFDISNIAKQFHTHTQRELNNLLEKTWTSQSSLHANFRLIPALSKAKDFFNAIKIKRCSNNNVWYSRLFVCWMNNHYASARPHFNIDKFYKDGFLQKFREIGWQFIALHLILTPISQHFFMLNNQWDLWRHEKLKRMLCAESISPRGAKFLPEVMDSEVTNHLLLRIPQRYVDVLSQSAENYRSFGE